jgi:Ankyrin repeats (3 copies)
MDNDNQRTKLIPKWIWIVLVISFPGSLLFLSRMVYEMTYLTWSNGPQMVGFSLIHNNQILFFYFTLSLLILIVGLIISAVLLIFRYKKLKRSRAFFTLFVSSAIIVILFFVPYGFYQMITIRILGGGNHSVETFIYFAATGDRNMTNFFLKRGININSQDSYGRTALMSATVSNEKHLVELLIKQGADVNLYDNSNSCALRDAVSTGNIEIAKILINQGADLQNLKRMLWADSIIYRSKNPIDQANFNDFKNRDKIITILLKENNKRINAR